MTFTQRFNPPQSSATYEIEAASIEDAARQTRESARRYAQPCRWSVTEAGAWMDAGIHIAADSATAPAWWCSTNGPFERANDISEIYRFLR